MAAHTVASKRLYFTVFGTLLVLTATTVSLDYVELGRLNLVIALLIACTKATLVALFFMHVKQSSGLTKIFVVAGLFWMGILILLTFSDYVSRDWVPTPQSWSSPQAR
jgi:cytochrome c oxidase subunit 4